jgi:hypothetical protein
MISRRMKMEFMQSALCFWYSDVKEEEDLSCQSPTGETYKYS